MGRALCFVASVMAFTSIFASAQVNSWINPASGNWDDPPSWSLGVLPSSSQSVMITNSGFKAVAINPSTPANFPDSMTVSNLTIAGSTNSENTLLLNFFGTAIPLTVLNGLTVADDAQVLNLNSGLIVQGGTITVTNSQINQDGGFIITTNAPMTLQASVYNLTNGDFEGGQVVLGAPVSATFNQFAGTALITNLVFGTSASGGNSGGGNYALVGGNLSLPNGLTITGANNSSSSYLQSGGTNQTTQVMIEPGLFGISPSFTLNDGLLADDNVMLDADDFGLAILTQNGGTHVVTNALNISGSAVNLDEPHPASYELNGGTLSALSLTLNASEGPAAFNQTNGTAQIGNIQASSGGSGNSYFNTEVDLSGGTLNCSNLFITDGGDILQTGGALTVSNTLSVVGFFNPGLTYYTEYDFFGGTLAANDINIGGNWVIGNGTTNRISNPGFLSLSHTLTISNATEQLGSFILASNATIDLAGSASRLSFAKSSGQTWAAGTTLVIADWNGNPSGGGAEQLKFGTDQTGLTLAQLGQIQFQVGTNSVSAKILNTGEVVPTGQPFQPTIAFSQHGSNLVLAWPPGWTLQSATNVPGPYLDVTNATSPYTNVTTLQPQEFFRLAQ